LLVLAACAATTGLQAQSVPSGGQANARSSGQLYIEGRVLTSAGAPLALASVEIAALDIATLTNDEGRFRLEGVTPGTHPVIVGLMGYETRVVTVEVGSGAAPLEVRLTPDPVMLERITVTANRFEARMRGVPFSVRVMDKREVMGSAAPDAANFVSRRGGLVPAPCRNRTQTDCVQVRGISVQPRVYINDFPAVGGLAMLGVIPAQEISRVEVIQGGAMIRVYTDEFMEWAAKHNYRPVPIGIN
jgi:hypothetical protein